VTLFSVTSPFVNDESVDGRFEWGEVEAREASTERVNVKSPGKSTGKTAFSCSMDVL
jgi:hypothetical protein